MEDLTFVVLLRKKFNVIKSIPGSSSYHTYWHLHHWHTIDLVPTMEALLLKQP